MSDATKNASGQAAVEVRSLSKHYGNIAAVNRVSFTVKKGEILGFLGPNGAGKTTTMRMITGYLSPSSGAVYVNGKNVFDNPLWVKRQIGYLPETPPLYTDMTTRAYLDHVANLKSIPHRDIPKEIDYAIERCGLEAVEHRLIQHCSKGYRQRVGLAQALLGSPALLILDEPTVGLDPAQIREVRSLIQDLAQDHTVILSTHILPEVQIICDRVIIIHKGELVASDTIENLNRSTTDESRIRIVLSEPNSEALSVLENYPGVHRVRHLERDTAFEVRMEAADPSLLTHLLDKGFDIAEFYNVAPTLEELFLRIVSGRDLSEEEDEELGLNDDFDEDEDEEEELEASEEDDEDDEDDEDEEDEEDAKDDKTEAKAEPSEKSDEKSEDADKSDADEGDDSSDKSGESEDSKEGSEEEKSEKKRKKRKKRKK